MLLWYPQLAMFCERLSAIHVDCLILSLWHTHTHTHTHTHHTHTQPHTTPQTHTHTTHTPTHTHKTLPIFTSQIFTVFINNLTTVSPVYSQDFVVHQRSDSLILLFYSQTDSVLSGVMGLISELKPEQHNLHLWRHNHSTCREQWHTLHSLRSDQFSWNTLIKRKNNQCVTHH